VTSFEQAYRSALSAALRSGEILAPQRLLADLATVEEPILVLTHPEHLQRVFGVLQEDFAFIPHVRNTRQQPSDEAMRNWASLLRWLIKGLKNWHPKNDPQGVTLAALLAFSAFVAFPGHWEVLPNAIGNNRALRTALASFVSKSAIQYDVRGIAPVPIWQTEAVENLKRADADNDWVAIERHLQPMQVAIRPNAFQSQLVTFLFRFGFAELVVALDKVRQTPAMMILVMGLRSIDLYRLGVASDSARVQFCCVYTALKHRSAGESFTYDETNALRLLLIKVAAQPERWHDWMQIFNTYPVRYPSLQTALGRALARVSAKGVETYVGSVSFVRGRQAEAISAVNMLRFV
jgi:hypothetical protein